MSFLQQKIDEFNRIIKVAVDTYKPEQLLVGFTGGGDSLTVLHLMVDSGIPFKPFFCNTGIGIKEQWEFIRRYCKVLNLELIEQTPVYKTYKQMILTNGFPGPSAHLIMFSNLKEKSIKYINDLYNGKAVFITGVRISESERRKINVTSEIQFDPKQKIKWCNPIMNWDDDDKEEYLENKGIKQSPVSELIGFSGECLCGAYAKKGELDRIQTFFPDTAKEIIDLQNILFDIGFTWGWNESPPSGKEYDLVMDKIFPGFSDLKALKRKQKEIKKSLNPLCHKCEVGYATQSEYEQYIKSKQ